MNEIRGFEERGERGSKHQGLSNGETFEFPTWEIHRKRYHTCECIMKSLTNPGKGLGNSMSTLF